MLWNDLRFGLRMLRRDPAFTAVAVLTLALGIGANTAIFTLFNAILLQSLPVREPARLVLLSDERSEGTFTGNVPSGRWTLFSYELFEFLGRQALPFEGIAGAKSGQATVSVRLPGAAQTERAQAQLVSSVSCCCWRRRTSAVCCSCVRSAGSRSSPFEWRSAPDDRV